MPLARTVAGALAGVWAGAALAQAGPPLPPPRPADLRPPSAEAPDAPLPPPRPADLGAAPATAVEPLPAPDAAGPAAPTAPPPAPSTAPAAAVPPPPAPPAPAAVLEHEACLEALSRLGVRFEPMPPIKEGACGAERPLRVSELPGGVAVSPPATTNCPMAEALGRWTADALVPEAQRLLNRRPVRLLVGTSYECRGQNRVAGARLSEHGFANGVDIGGVHFAEGKPHTVALMSGESLEGRFQAEIQARACAYFTTVLGPGSDAAHAGHFHLDLRGRKGGFRICQ